MQVLIALVKKKNTKPNLPPSQLNQKKTKPHTLDACISHENTSVSFIIHV